MSDPVQLIFEELAADSVLSARLSEYAGGPAVFSGDRIPEDASLPYIWIRVPSDAPWDTKDIPGRDVLVDLGCYGKDTGSSEETDALAAAARDVFRRRDPFPIGTGSVLCLWAGTLPAPTGQGVVGRIVTIRLVWQEASDLPA